MVASIGAFEGKIGEFILALFDANIEQFSDQKNQNKSLPTLKKGSEEQASQNFASKY